MPSWLKRSKPDADPPGNGGMQADPFAFVNQASQHVMFVKKLALNQVDDITLIQQDISDGNLAIIDVAGFISSGQYSVLELKRAIEQIRGTCKNLGGALARLGDRYLVATPNDRARLMV